MKATLAHQLRQASIGVVMQPQAHQRSAQLKLFVMPNPFGERMGAEFFKSLPAAPGVYRFYGSDDRLLYVGQSNDLRARVSSYRHVVPERHPQRTLRMVGRITRIEWEVCATAETAIAREKTLLLELRPPFNRAGVWQGSPWWFHAEVAHGGLSAQISRVPIEGGIGPLPSPFRYVFASLMRCTYRLLHPEVVLAAFPMGLLNQTIPPSVRWPVPDTSNVGSMLTRWVGGDIEPFLARWKAVSPARPVSQAEADYWLEQFEILTKFDKKRPVPSALSCVV